MSFVQIAYRNIVEGYSHQQGHLTYIIEENVSPSPWPSTLSDPQGGWGFLGPSSSMTGCWQSQPYSGLREVIRAALSSRVQHAMPRRQHSPTPHPSSGSSVPSASSSALFSESWRRWHSCSMYCWALSIYSHHFAQCWDSVVTTACCINLLWLKSKAVLF